MKLSESLQFEDVPSVEERQAARIPLNEREYDQVRNLSGEERTQRFFKVIFDKAEVWLLFDADGLVPLRTEPGRWVIPAWYHPDLIDDGMTSTLNQTKGEVRPVPVPIDDFYDVIILNEMMQRMDLLVAPVGTDGVVITFGTAIDAAARRHHVA